MRKLKRQWLSVSLAVCFGLSSVLSPILLPVAAAETPQAILQTASTGTLVSVAERFGGTDRYDTAAKIAREGWKTASNFAILAGGNDVNLVDALAAAPLAKQKNAPILLTESGGNTLNSFAEAELKRLEVKTVYVVSGEGIVTPAVLEKLQSMGISVVKLGGRDRFETSVNIAKQIGNFSKVVLATGWNYADAASVTSIAAAKGMPILLTDINTLPASVNAFLGENRSKISQTFVLGGERVIGNNVFNTFPNPQRLYGADRFATNREVLKFFADDLKYGKTYLANGEDGSLVDALVGSSLAALTSSPILLISNPPTEDSIKFAKLNLGPNYVVLGGEGAVPGTAIKKLVNTLMISADGVVQGGSKEAQPEQITDTLKITGKNVNLQNAKTDYSIYVQGDNATLTNVTVAGTVFLDPGEQGSANLDNVKAGKIVILSGAKDSIHIKNSEAGTLVISSSTEVRVESSGTTKVGNTIVTSYAILDAQGGSLGTVEVISAPGQVPVVTLKGTFTEPIVINGAATLKADANASIAKVEVAPENKDQIITLEGNFKSVEVNSEANLNLGATAVIQDLVTNVKADIVVDSGAKVEKFDNKGNEGNITGEGAQNVPASGQTPPASSGSGGSGDDTAADTTVPERLTISTESGSLVINFESIVLENNQQITYQQLIDDYGLDLAQSEVYLVTQAEIQAGSLTSNVKASLAGMGERIDASAQTITLSDDDLLAIGSGMGMDGGLFAGFNPAQHTGVFVRLEGFFPTEGDDVPWEISDFESMPASSGLDGLSLKNAATQGDITVGPAFNSGVTTYTAQVGSDVGAVTVVVSAPSGAVMVNGIPAEPNVSSGDYASDVSLAPGENNISIMVVEPGKAPGEYTLTVTKDSPGGGGESGDPWTQLAALIGDAQTAVNSAVIGEQPGQYCTGAVEALQDAIDDAIVVRDDENAAPEMLGTTLSSLSLALTAFQQSVVPGGEEEADQTAAEIAAGITSVTQPAQDATQLDLPSVPAGFSMVIKSSSNGSVIALDGSITPPDADTDVTLVFTVSNEVDQADPTADTVGIVVTVPARSEGGDSTAPQLSGLSATALTVGDALNITSDEDGNIYLVPSATEQTAIAIIAIAETPHGVAAVATANVPVDIDTTGLNEGYYLVYALDAAGNLSAPSEEITLTVPAEAPELVSAVTGINGYTLEVLFSKDMMGLFDGAAGFAVTADGQPVSVTGVAFKGGEPATLLLTLDTELQPGQTITLSYTPGNITSGEGAVLAAFSDQAVTNGLSEPVSSTVNGLGNSNNRSIAAYDSGWVYYVDNERAGLNKMDAASGTTTIPIDPFASNTFSLSVVGNNLYFLAGSAIYAVDKTKIVNDDLQSVRLGDSHMADTMQVVGDSIYFVDYITQHIFKMGTDGSGITELNNVVSSSLQVSGTWIYYLSSDGGSEKIYRMATDGTQNAIVDSDVNASGISASEFLVSGGYIYYANAADGFKIYKVAVDGSGAAVKLADDQAQYLNLSGDWIYYKNHSDKEGLDVGTGDEGRLYRVKTDGSVRQKVTDDNIGYLSIAGDWIFYVAYPAPDTWVTVKVRLDGTEREALVVIPD